MNATPNTQTYQETVNRFIDTAGQFTKSIGLGRALGQVYAVIYFGQENQTLDSICETLSISKGSASMSVRQLEQWGALKKVWVKGDRKDYYEASTGFGDILRKIMSDIMGTKLSDLDEVIREAESTIRGLETMDKEDEATRTHIQRRVIHLRVFREHTKKIWNNTIIKMLIR